MTKRTVVLDFETTGLSANNGDRTIEVGAVALEGGKIVDSFQSLMNPGCRINAFIENYTGINNAMLKTAPPCEEVIGQLHEFVGDSVLVAHNASFDQNFFVSELERLNQSTDTQFICTMLVGRRLYPLAPNHKLATLAKLHNISTTGHHRALADAVMTAELLHSMTADLEGLYSEESIDAPFMRKYQKTRKADTRSSNKTLSRYSWS